MFDSLNFRNTFSLAAAILVAGTAIALPSSAHADRKTLPGTVCQVWGGSQTSAVSYSQFGKVINNSSTKRLGVVCPIVRDNTGSAPNWIRVYYNDAHFHGTGNGVLECRVRANSVYGDTSSDSQWVGTNPAGGTYSGSWTYWHIDGVWNDGNYTVFCLIPPTEPGSGDASYIGSIIIDE